MKNETLYIIRVIGMGGVCSRHGKYGEFISDRKSESKISLGRPKHRSDDKIKMDPKKIWSKSMEWIHLTHDRIQQQGLVSMVMNLWVP
jgi:hypothetical protein